MQKKDACAVLGSTSGVLARRLAAGERAAPTRPQRWPLVKSHSGFFCFVLFPVRLLFSQFRIPQHSLPLTLSTRKAQNKPCSGKYLIKPFQNCESPRGKYRLITGSWLESWGTLTWRRKVRRETLGGRVLRPPEPKGHRVRLPGRKSGNSWEANISWALTMISAWLIFRTPWDGFCYTTKRKVRHEGDRTLKIPKPGILPSE